MKQYLSFYSKIKRIMLKNKVFEKFFVYLLNWKRKFVFDDLKFLNYDLVVNLIIVTLA